VWRAGPALRDGQVANEQNPFSTSGDADRLFNQSPISAHYR
jgi:hypothetical protein